MESFKQFLRKIIPKAKSTKPYDDRESRARFISKRFQNYLHNSVLDVGSSDNNLKNYITDEVNYVSVDITGDPTFKIDLEKEKLSKFEDNSFDTVVCTEVLEHLDNLHEVFDDLCRVSNKFVIISLPNNWLTFKFLLLKNTGSTKFYGLPLEKPLDRHKWFFNYEEALNFVKKRGEKNSFNIRFYFPVSLQHFGLQIRLFNTFFRFYYKNKFGFNNTFFSSLWVLLEKLK